MEIITLSGFVYEDSEKKTDKKGHEFFSFKMCCEKHTLAGKIKTTIYRCYSYNSETSELKKGDQAFLTGEFNLNEIHGKAYCDIFVQQFTKGIKNNA